MPVRALDSTNAAIPGVSLEDCSITGIRTQPSSGSVCRSPNLLLRAGELPACTGVRRGKPGRCNLSLTKEEISISENRAEAHSAEAPRTLRLTSEHSTFIIAFLLEGRRGTHTILGGRRLALPVLFLRLRVKRTEKLEAGVSDQALHQRNRTTHRGIKRRGSIPQLDSRCGDLIARTSLCFRSEPKRIPLATLSLSL